MIIETTAAYAASLGFLTVVLGLATVIKRAKSNISSGDGDNDAMRRAVRAHGNLIEYMPIFLIILVLLENAGVSATWLHALGAVFVIGRVVSAVYFWISQKFILRVLAFWAAVLPIAIGAALLLFSS
jgi:uncharacterized membrane protein YecN with MAPEG domain